MNGRRKSSSTCFQILLLTVLAVVSCASLAWSANPTGKPPITLDEFFSFVEIQGLDLAPDGNRAVIGTERADWKQNRFRDDLWIWSAEDNSITPLTTTGHDSDPHFSPDGKYIAFLSNRPLIAEAEAAKDAVERVWILPVQGGGAFPLYKEPLSVDAFTWSGDGKAIFVATQQPISEEAKTAEKKAWKDTVRWREQRRGEDILRVPIASAIPQPDHLMASASEPKPDADKEPRLPTDAVVVAQSPLAITELVAAPDGSLLAFESRSLLNRQENPSDYEIFSVAADGTGATPRQLTHNQAYEEGLHWSRDSKTLYFSVPAAAGSAEQPYQDVQGRLYGMDPASGKITRLGGDYAGSGRATRSSPTEACWDAA